VHLVYDGRVKKVFSLTIKVLFFFLLFFFSSFVFIKDAKAAITATVLPSPLQTSASSIEIRLHSDSGEFTKSTYTGILSKGGTTLVAHGTPSADKNDLTLRLDRRPNVPFADGDWKFVLYAQYISESEAFGTGAQKFWEMPSPIRVFPVTGTLSLELPAKKIQAGISIPLYVHNVDPNQDYTVWIQGAIKTLHAGKFPENQITTDIHGDPNTVTMHVTFDSKSRFGLGQKQICLKIGTDNIEGDVIVGNIGCTYSISFEVVLEPQPSSTSRYISGETGYPTPNLYLTDQPTPFPPTPPCSNDDAKAGKCKIPTGLGIDFPTNPQEFVKTVFSILLGVAGGLALFLIIFSGYRLMTSQGNPETIQGARETLTSAIVGLLFIVFSFVILEVIGVDILHIPGFGR